MTDTACICDSPNSGWGYWNGYLIKCPYHKTLRERERLQRLSFPRQGKQFVGDKPFNAVYLDVRGRAGDYPGFKRLCQAMGTFASNPKGWHLLLGQPGTYKSTLLSAIYQVHPLSVYIDLRNLVDALYLAARREEGDHLEIDEIVHKYGTVPVLLLDELGAEYGNGKSEFITSHVTGMLNERYARRLPTIIASNLDERGIEQRYGERLASRLLDKSLVTVWHIDLPDMRRI